MQLTLGIWLAAAEQFAIVSFENQVIQRPNIQRVNERTLKTEERKALPVTKNRASGRYVCEETENLEVGVLVKPFCFHFSGKACSA